ncbi:MAG: adenosine deaminase [Lachnospiraceae bacterium]
MKMIDLHLHLDGSINPKNMVSLAEMTGVKLPTNDLEELKKRMMVKPDCRNLGEYLEKFDLPCMVLQTKESLEFAVYELLRELSGQGLCYAEIRFAPQLHTNKGMTQAEAVEAAVKGLEKGRKDFSMPSNLILCCMRGDKNQSDNMETVEVAEKFLGRGVCAVDLAGNEAAYPTNTFSNLFYRAGEKKIPIIIHAGEAAGAESVKEALKFGAVRIGHGIHALEDANLMEQLKEQKITLECCYSSNLQTKAVQEKESYPIRQFYDKGICATVNTDNMIVSNTTLKNEYLRLKNELGIETDVLQQLAFNAADGAFVSENEKLELKKHIAEEFDAWLA